MVPHHSEWISVSKAFARDSIQKYVDAHDPSDCIRSKIIKHVGTEKQLLFGTIRPIKKDGMDQIFRRMYSSLMEAEDDCSGQNLREGLSIAFEDYVENDIDNIDGPRED